MEFNESYLTKLNETEARSKSNTKRLDELESKQADLVDLKSQIAVMQSELAHITTELQEMKATLKTITEKPAKRWDALVEKVLTVIAGAVIGYLATRLGVS